MRFYHDIDFPMKISQKKIFTIIHSSEGHDIFLFIIFLFISFIFWALLTLNNEEQKELEIPVQLTDIPQNVTLITSMPTDISVSVRDKGASLLKYYWGQPKPIKLSFTDFSKIKNKILVSENELKNRVRAYFGGNANILSIKPDSINVAYTSLPGVKAKIKLISDIHPNFQYIISGPITANTDSVSLYSVNDTILTIHTIETIPVTCNELKDTTKIEVKITPIDEVKIVPDHITITIPIEPLIAKKQQIAINAENIPTNLELITFPSKIDVSYLLPMSQYNTTHTPIKAYVNYDDIKDMSSKLPLYLYYDKNVYRNLSFYPDSVEYIIEKKSI